MKKLLLLLSTTISIAILLFGSATAGSLWGKISDEEWKLTPPASLPDANAAVVFDVCTLTVSIDNIDTRRHVRLKLFNKQGASDVGDITISYHKDDGIRDFKAQTISPDGKVTKVDGKDVHVKELDNWREKTFAFPAADSGCILEYTYRNVNSRFHRLDPWYFQAEVFTFKSAFTLVLAPGFSYVTSVANVPAADRAGVSGDYMLAGANFAKMKTFTWTRSNVLAIKDEPYMGCENDFTSSLHHQLVSYDNGASRYAYISDWKELGEDFQKFIDGYATGGDLKELVAEVTTGATSDTAKARLLYEWVANNIKYDAAGTKGWFRNDNLSQLRKAGSGSGEEKNILLCQLLRKANIQAWPVLISTRSHGKFNPEIYQTQQFDYIITYAQFDSAVIFMDAISKYCPFGMIPPDKLADGGCLIDGSNSQLVKILRHEPENYRIDSTDVLVDSNGTAHCTTRCTFAGYFAPNYGEFHEAETPEEFLRQYFLNKIDEHAVIDSNRFSIDSTGHCVLEASYSLKDYARLLDNNLALRPICYRFRENPFVAPKRQFPIDFDFKQKYTNVITVHSDKKVTTAQLPPKVEVTTDGASYSRVSFLENETVRIVATLKLEKEIYSPFRYGDMKKLFESVAKAQQDDIILTLGT
ncbi:MAG: DUF3857 and transglutaminase domain-containing protein [Candidatus Zixiibacteriota bacterium]